MFLHFITIIRPHKILPMNLTHVRVFDEVALWHIDQNFDELFLMDF